MRLTCDQMPATCGTDRRTAMRGAGRDPGVLVAAILAIALLGSCANIDGPKMPEPRPIPPSVRAPAVDVDMSTTTGPIQTDTVVREGLQTPLGRTSASPYSSEAPPSLSGEKISVTFDGINLPTFINTVFGDLLKVSFEIDSAVTARQQIVTLRTNEPVDPDAFYGLVTQVLGNYGISVVYQNGVYRIVESANRRQDLPRIIWSRASANMPEDMRPIFQFVQLKNTQTAFMTTWLNVALQERIQIQGVNQLNGLLILGKSEDVAAAIETIEVLDQPHMAGSRSMKISPRYWSAQKLGEQLVQVLTAEGYTVGVASDGTLAIKLVIVAPLNTIIVFTVSAETMQHVINWAAELDQPSQTVNTLGIYYYQVKNSSAAELADVLSRVMGGPGVSNTATATPGTAAAMNAGAVAGAGARTAEQGTGRPAASGTGQVIVDTARNAIIFRGTAEEFSQFRALADQMDRAPLQVMIEATIAEVTLNEGEDLSVALSFDNGVAAKANATAIKSDEGILISLIRDRGDFIGTLNSSANKNKVTILSSPRVVASSGKAANIQVGTQVPIITTQQTAPDGTVGGNSSLLQDIQYRNTGVNLSVTPAINSNRRVDLTIAQEVSEAQANRISTVQSPTIFTRAIQTTLALNDGQTVLLGGLISENFSKGDTGVPMLKDIPILGSLFKTQSTGRTRIELIVLLTPYIIDGPESAQFVRDAFKNDLGQLPPIGMTNYAPLPDIPAPSPVPDVR
ncbi:MAG: secretin N-terminal domain-containing protein [Rhodospirillaceae bacterium]|nr:secretin N-terminal domain-containing protein [Rhodospirillaceae bacterium]